MSTSSTMAGGNDFIGKPFDPQALIRKVRRLAEEARGEPAELLREALVMGGRNREIEAHQADNSLSGS